MAAPLSFRRKIVQTPPDTVEKYRTQDLINLPEEKKIGRSGIIPFTVINGRYYYALFIDAHFNEITDGGGKRNPGENLIEAGLRELGEESMGVFKMEAKEVVGTGITIVGNIHGNQYRPYDGVPVATTLVEMKGLDEKAMLAQMEAFRHKYEAKIVEQAQGGKVDRHTLENKYLLWMSEETIFAITQEGKSEFTSVCHEKGTCRFIRDSEARLEGMMSRLAAGPIRGPVIVKARIFTPYNSWQGRRPLIASATYPRLYPLMGVIFRQAYTKSKVLALL